MDSPSPLTPSGCPLACQKRRGEAPTVFLDDVPTYRYLAVLPYWLARDPLVVDAGRRLSVP